MIVQFKHLDGGGREVFPFILHYGDDSCDNRVGVYAECFLKTTLVERKWAKERVWRIKANRPKE